MVLAVLPLDEFQFVQLNFPKMLNHDCCKSSLDVLLETTVNADQTGELIIAAARNGVNVTEREADCNAE